MDRGPQFGFALLALSDVNEVQHHAIDSFLTRAIRNDPDEEVLAVLVPHLALNWNQIEEDALGVVWQAGVIDLAGEIREGPADVARNNIEQFLDAWRKTFDPQLAIQKAYRCRSS